MRHSVTELCEATRQYASRYSFDMWSRQRFRWFGAARLVIFRHGILPDPQSRPVAQRTANHMPVHLNGSGKEIDLRRCVYTPLVG